MSTYIHCVIPKFVFHTHQTQNYAPKTNSNFGFGDTHHIHTIIPITKSVRRCWYMYIEGRRRLRRTYLIDVNQAQNIFIFSFYKQLNSHLAMSGWSVACGLMFYELVFNSQQAQRERESREHISHRQNCHNYFCVYYKKRVPTNMWQWKRVVNAINEVISTEHFWLTEHISIYEKLR